MATCSMGWNTRLPASSSATSTPTSRVPSSTRKPPKSSRATTVRLPVITRVGCSTPNRFSERTMSSRYLVASRSYF